MCECVCSHMCISIRNDGININKACCPYITFTKENGLYLGTGGLLEDMCTWSDEMKDL